MQLKINVNAIPYVIENNLSIEFFIWSYLRMLNNSGFCSFNLIDSNIFCLSTVKQKKYDNIFYYYKNNNFILTSMWSLDFMGLKGYKSDFDWIKSCVKLEGSKLNAKTMRYFLISIYACKYENKKPYALSLIAEDLDISIKTVQRALKFFDVQSTCVVQDDWSPRSYHYEGHKVNLSANYNFMSNGEFFKYNVY